MKKCPNCGTENQDESQFCINCGKPLAPESAGPVGSAPPGPMRLDGESAAAEPTSAVEPSTPPAQEEVVPPPAMPVEPTPAESTPAPPPPPVISGPPPGVAPATPQPQTALWSLILGILSLFCFGVITGTIAIILAVQARKNPRENQGMATAGLVLGIVGVVLSIVGIIFFIIGMVAPNAMD